MMKEKEEKYQKTCDELNSKINSIYQSKQKNDQEKDIIKNQNQEYCQKLNEYMDIERKLKSLNHKKIMENQKLSKVLE